MAPAWLSRALARIRRLVARRRVRFTLKALAELDALGLGLDADDAVEIVAGLSPADFVGRVSSEHTHEWMYVFKPSVAGTVVYLKLIIRQDCVIISFHEDEAPDDEDET